MGSKEMAVGEVHRPSSLSVAPGAPITVERPVRVDDLDKYIEKPHVPRATAAVDREHPDGSKNHEAFGLSVLQQHVAFFDRNGDGKIYPWETLAGFHAAGFNIIISLIGMFIIHASFSWVTQDGWLPDLFLSVVIRNIHQGKHGSDTGVYDKEGRFVPAKFEEMFSKFDEGNKGALTFWEILRMTEANREVFDFFGWVAGKLEWFATWLLLAGRDWRVSKDDIRGVYDGSTFERMERRKTKKSD